MEEEYFPQNRAMDREYPPRHKNGVRKWIHLNKQGAVMALWPVEPLKGDKLWRKGGAKMRIAGGETVKGEPITLELADLKRLRQYVSEVIACLEGREFLRVVESE